MIIYRLYEAQKIKNKLSLNLAMACIFIFSSCATVKDVGTISEVSQAVLTGGASLVPLPGNDKVKIAINGRVILSTKCNFDYS